MLKLILLSGRFLQELWHLEGKDIQIHEKQIIVSSVSLAEIDKTKKQTSRQTNKQKTVCCVSWGESILVTIFAQHTNSKLSVVQQRLFYYVHSCCESGIWTWYSGDGIISALWCIGSQRLGAGVIWRLTYVSGSWFGMTGRLDLRAYIWPLCVS